MATRFKSLYRSKFLWKQANGKDERACDGADTPLQTEASTIGPWTRTTVISPINPKWAAMNLWLDVFTSRWIAKWPERQLLT